MARLLLLILFACPLTSLAQSTAQPQSAALAIIDNYFEDASRAIIRNQKIAAGDTLYLSFRVAGFKQSDDRRVLLNWWVECDDPQGTPLAEVNTGKIETVLSREDDKWRPKVDWSLVVPNYAASGQFTVLIRVRDELAQKETSVKMPFQVRGIDMKPSETLGVGQFEFLESEDGKVKTSSEFTTPSTLWARFRIVGFRISNEKQVQVGVDLSILDQDGKVVFSRPNAADDSLRLFYPPRFLTETFNLDLQKGIKPGAYTIRLDLHDLVGKQEGKYEVKFSIT